MKNNKKLIKLLIKLREIKPKKKTILSMLTKQLMNTMIEVYCKIILFTNIKKITFQISIKKYIKIINNEQGHNISTERS